MAAPTQRPSVAPATLSSEINTATRSLHTDLNKLITSRLPLALPPFAPDPSLYTTGLLHFAHIFLTFESLWADLPPPNATFDADADADAPSSPTSPLLSYLLVNPYAEPNLFTSTSTTVTPSPQLLAFLHSLRPNGLPRSNRLKKDLQNLTNLHPTDFDVLLSKYPSEEVAAFCAHIRASVGAKPHVLVAYAWCFYMAIFSGGRWIRAELVRSGPDFWTSGLDSHAEVDAGIDAERDPRATEIVKKFLSLWYFPGALDGEDIKAAFKQRLLGAEELFSAEQRVDVVQEAKIIFQRCAGVVHELDGLVGTDLERVGRVRVAEMAKGGGGQVHAAADVREGVTGRSVMSAVVTGKEALAGWASSAWLRRPEVTGAAVAIGCLACAVALRLSY